MNRIPVSSTNVVSVGYDAETQTLEIEFESGTVYQYFDVSEAVHEALMASDTVGGFVNTQLKGHYRYARV